VSLAEDESPQLLRSCTAVAGGLERWRIVSVPVEPGYPAAVAAGQVSGESSDAPNLRRTGSVDRIVL
jgi:hypothetical protein